MLTRSPAGPPNSLHDGKHPFQDGNIHHQTGASETGRDDVHNGERCVFHTIKQLWEELADFAKLLSFHNVGEGAWVSPARTQPGQDAGRR